MRNLPRYHLSDARAETNVGDLLGPALLARMIGPGTTTLVAAETPKLISVGSSLTVSYRPGDTVWGAGIVSDGGRVTVTEPDKILAVRGPLTHARMAGLPQRRFTYGDPALLCPLYWPAPTKPRKYVGILPHWIDVDHNPFPGESGSTIQLSITDPIEELIERLAECHMVITTSLHGLILADAYRVPTVIWDASWSGQIVGGRFKFYDYLAATGRSSEPGLLPKLEKSSLISIQRELTRALESAL